MTGAYRPNSGQHWSSHHSVMNIVQSSGFTPQLSDMGKALTSFCIAHNQNLAPAFIKLDSVGKDCAIPVVGGRVWSKTVELQT